MKKLLSFTLVVITVLCVFVLPISASVTTDLETPYDVPKILITTSSTINKDSYVTCTIKVIDQEGGEHETIVDEAAQIKIRGNSTSGAHKKPWNIKFSSKTDVLGMGKNKKWALLANCYDKTLIRNNMVFDFAREAEVPYTPDGRTVDVYVNGELMGCYNIVDSVEVSSTRVDIDLDNNEYLMELDYYDEADVTYYNTSTYDVRFAFNEPEEPTVDQQTYIGNLFESAEAALASGDYALVEQYFDIESMVNFYVTLEFFRNVDVSTSSTRFHVKGDKIYGGPVWDFDLSAGNYNPNYYTQMYRDSEDSWSGLYAINMAWFGALVGYDEFQTLVEERFLELQDVVVNLYSDNINGQNRVDWYLDTYGASFDRNNIDAGWSCDRVYRDDDLQLEMDPLGSFEAHIEHYRKWLKNRNAYLLEKWGLNDTIVTVNSDSDLVQDGYFINGVVADTTASSLKGNFGAGVSVKKDGVALADADKVPNGAVITAGGASYAITVMGDCCSDGSVDSLDYVTSKRHVLGTVSLEGLDFDAADVENDGTIDVFDYVLLKRHVLGTYNIYG